MRRSTNRRRESDREVARLLLLCLRLYPNYRVDSRGPLGLLTDAIELTYPDIIPDLEDSGAHAAYEKHFPEDDDG